MRPGNEEISILVVEDHPFQLIAMEMQLNQLGFYRLAEAVDFDEALLLIESGRRFDLMICDQNLPDGSGLDLISVAHRAGAIDAAVLITGLDDKAHQEKTVLTAKKLGLPLLAYLEKPVSKAQLLSACVRRKQDGHLYSA